jgi:hypothetical protein
MKTKLSILSVSLTLLIYNIVRDLQDGIYLYRMDAGFDGKIGRFTEVKRMLILH